MRYSKYPNDWLYTDYSKTFLSITGSHFNKEESDFVDKKLCDTTTFNDMKKLYYDVVYELDFYPRWIIKLFLQLRLKKILVKLEAPQSIINVHKEFADLILHQAIRAYLKYKSSDLRNHFDM